MAVTLRGPCVPVRLEFELLLLFSFLAGVVSCRRALFRFFAACFDGFVDEFLYFIFLEYECADVFGFLP